MSELAPEDKHNGIPGADALRAVLVGLVVGLIGFAFRASARALRAAIAIVVPQSPALEPNGSDLALAVGLPLVVAGVAWAVSRYAPETAGSGVQEIEANLLGLRELRALRVLLMKFTGGVLALGVGMPLGREGPTVHMGGAIGEFLHDRGQGSGGERENRNLAVAAGAGAGLAAAFNAPLSGIMLILEEMRRHFRFSARSLQFVALATLSADITVRLLAGGAPVLDLGAYRAPAPSTIPLFLLFGAACGLAGVFFNRMVLFALDHLGMRARGLVAPLVGGFALWLAWRWAPQLLGDGYDLMPDALRGNTSSLFLGMLILSRILFTSAIFASGVPGGIFAPLVTVGVLLGCALAPSFRQLGLNISNIQLAVAGMGGMFAAMVHAPITGIVLAIELTGQLSASLPLLATAAAAAATARFLGGRPIYDMLGERLVPLTPSPTPIATEPAPAAAFPGKKIHSSAPPP